ncbi:hypothetical protein LXL04_008591 [Taraxacum kok-saghyz]
MLWLAMVRSGWLWIVITPSSPWNFITPCMVDAIAWNCHNPVLPMIMLYGDVALITTNSANTGNLQIIMENTKWIATVASIWIQCSCGASYAFGIYSTVLKSSQGYDQSTLDTVSVFKDIGANIGVLAGLLYHAVADNKTGGRSRPSSSRFGSGLSVVYLAGAIQFFAGYFLMWLSTIGVIEKPHVSLMCFFMFIAAQGQTFFNTTNVVVAVQNFPDYSGTTVGIMKGFLGLSGAILIQIYQTLFDGNPSAFLLMLAVFPAAMSLLLMSLIHVNPSNTTNDKRHLNGFSLIAVLIAAYLTIILLFENIFAFPSWAHIPTTVVLMMLLSSPLQVALTAQKTEPPPPSSPTMAPLIKASGEGSSSTNTGILEMNLLQAIGTVNFWLLFVPMMSGMGSGMATINNITQIGESLDYSTVKINAMVSLWSIWNFLGRIGGGFVSDLFLHRYGWGRPLFISLTQAAMVAGHLMIGLGGNLYIGSVIVGICYGSQWSLMPTITSEIFGVKHMGTIFNAIAAANPVGSYLLSVQVIGRIYDKEAEAGGGFCHGIHCFMVSYFVFAGVCVFGFLVSMVLFFRTRGFYALILQRRSKQIVVTHSKMITMIIHQVMFGYHSKSLEVVGEMAVNNKWMATVASIWIQCTSGSLYTFSFYSSALKATQGYDQSTLDAVSVFKDFGANFGILSGLLYSAVASPSTSVNFRGRKSGPWIVLLTGAIQCFVGYFLMWLSVTVAIPRPPVPLMCLFMLLAAHGVTFLNTANVVTAVLNFPNHSGTIVGIMKGFLGLSGAILLLVYQTVIKAEPTPYILMIALLPFLNTLFFMSSVKSFETIQSNEKKHLDSLSIISLLIAAYLFSIIIIQQTLPLNLPARIIVLLVLLILLASPLYVSLKSQSTENYQLLNNNPNNQEHESIHHDKNLPEAIRTVNFWCLFLTTATGMGTGLATVNNLAQVGESLGYTTHETTTLASLWSIWNFVGRFGAGYVSDHFLYTKKWARSVFIAITLGVMSIGHLVIASGFPGALYVGFVLVGVFYGSQWSLMPTIASEVFGVSHFGTIFNTITISGPIGSYFISVRVIGYLYDREVSREVTEYCSGTHCFRLSFIIMAIVTFLGSVVGMFLFFRTRGLYEQIVIRRERRSI